MLHEKLNTLLDNYGRGAQKKLADFLEESAVNVNRYAKGVRIIPISHIPKIAEFFDVSTDFLLGNETKKISHIPLIGKASCGVPNMYFNDYVEHIPVSDDIARDGVYAVEAEGDSMLPKIKHGDIIICDKEMRCENGNIIHYTTNDGESGIKKYSRDPKTEMVTLYPLNPDYTPIMIHRKELECARAFKIQSDL